MKTHKLIPMLLAVFAAIAEAHPTSIAGCEGANTTADVAECRSKQVDSANLKLEKYLAAARVRASAFDLSPASITEEQRAWEAYRTRHCGNVYDVWRDGTIRYEMSALCTLEVTRERTTDVWRAYLTYMDSTPPVLPDPSQAQP
jgi:uncharacterized protein YecT (DUF1311 family)